MPTEGLTVTVEAVSALVNMGDNLEERVEQIKAETAKLRTVFEENKGGLGAHSESILNLIEEIESAEGDSGKDVKRLVLKLNRSAKVRQTLIDDDKYKGSKHR